MDPLQDQEARPTRSGLRLAARGIGNVVVKTLVLLMFHAFGWITVRPVAPHFGFWGVVVTAVLVASVITIIAMGMSRAAFAKARPASLSLFLALPALNVLVLWLMTHLTPVTLTVSVQPHWLVLIAAGILLAPSWAPSSRKGRSIVVTPGAPTE